MKKSELKRLASFLTEKFSQQNQNFMFSQWFTACLHMIDSRLIKEKPPKKKKSSPENPCRIVFDNKALEIVNLAKIFKSPKILETIPSVAKGFQTPTVVYTMREAIGSKIFNFNNFSTSLDVKSFLKDPTILPCSCENSRYKDSYHNHIITGDLRIVDDIGLRKLLSRGPKYREAKQLDFESAKKEIVKGVENCIKAYCESHHLDKAVLMHGKLRF